MSAVMSAVLLLPHIAQAEQRLSKGCPVAFSIVDIGAWATNDAGEFVRSFGGTLVNIGQQDKTQQDAETAWVSCYPASYTRGQTQHKNDVQIPLVSHVVFPTGLGVTQHEHAEKVIENIQLFFQNHLPNAPQTEVTVSDELGTGICKLGPEISHGGVFRDYACLITMAREDDARLFFYCHAHPHQCGYYFSWGDGIMIYQQPSDYPFTRTAKTVDETAQAWIDFAFSGQSYVQQRLVSRDHSIILSTK